MSAGGLHIVMDARMLDHSGVGVYLETLLAGLHERLTADPDLEARAIFTLLGHQALFTKNLPASMSESSQRIAFRSKIYSLAEQLEAPGRIRAAMLTSGEGHRRIRAAELPVVFWPHYNFPLRWKGPMVVTVHDLIHSHYPPKRGTKWYQAMMLGALRKRLQRAECGGPSAHVLTDSRHVKVLLQRQWRFPPHRVWNVGVGLPPEFRPPKSETELNESLERTGRSVRLSARYWMTIGLHKPHKNYEWLLEQLTRYWAGGGFRDVELLMAGTGQSQELARRIEADAALRGRVKLLPRLPTDQLRALLWGAEALLFPSLAEGFGLPVLEAMACGTPVVCARRPPMDEHANGVAWFFDPIRPAQNDTPDELLDALRTISGDPEGRLADLAAPNAATPTTTPTGGDAAGTGITMGIDRAGVGAKEADVATRLRTGIARARARAPAAFAGRVLDVCLAAARRT